MINILEIILIVFMISLNVNVKKDDKINQNAKASVSNSVKSKIDNKEKIFKFIKLVQPKFTDNHVSEITEAIILYSNKYKIDPMLTTSVAYVESEFNMRSKPCIGIMQLVRTSIRFYDPFKQYNPYTIRGNIAIGCIEISKHYSNIRSNGLLPSRSSTRTVLLRYNGSRFKYSYAVKVMRVKSRIKEWDIDQIKKYIKINSLWN